MEACTSDLRCLICRRVTLKNVSIDSQVLVSHGSLLQDFLNCFHINYLDSEVSDLSTSCQFCLSCEQFITEWSSNQTQMTQLTRRNAQLKATLSALFLSEHEIQERVYNQDDTDVINSRIHQEVELSLLLQQTVDNIRNELQRKYSVRVLLDKITHVRRSKQGDLEGPNDVAPLPEKDTLPLSDSTHPVHVMADKIQDPPVVKLEPLPTVNVTVDEAWDHWECEENIQFPVVPKIQTSSGGYDNDYEPRDHSDFRTDDSAMECVPSQNDDETSQRILETRLATEKDANHNGSHFKVSKKKTKAKAGNRKTNVVSGSKPSCDRKSEKQPVVIPVRPKKFKNNAYVIRLSQLELENIESLPAPQLRVARSAPDFQPSPPVSNLVEAHDVHLLAEDEVPIVTPVLPPPSPLVVESPSLENYSIDGRPSSSLVARRRLRKRVAPASLPPPPSEVSHPPSPLPWNLDEDIDDFNIANAYKFVCRHDGCGKVFVSKRLLIYHRRCHVKIDCREANCDWRGAETKFNTHFKEIHLQVLRHCKHCGGPWESSQISNHETRCDVWTRKQQQASHFKQRAYYPHARARQEGDEDRLAEARLRAGLIA